MGGAHRHLLIHTAGPLHRLPAQCKLAATVLFVFAVVATPREQFWAFGVQAGLVVLAAVIGRVPLRSVARRLVIEVPFLLFAVLLPIVGREPRVDVLGISLSEAGFVGGVEHRRQGDHRSGGVDRVGVDHDDPPDPRRLGAVARAAGDGGDHRVHDPLRRCHRRRGASHVDRPPVPWRSRWPFRSGAGTGLDGRRPVRPVVRARAQRVLPGDGVPRLHAARCRCAVSPPRSAHGSCACRGRPRRPSWRSRRGACNE